MKCAVIKFAGTSGDGDCYHVLKDVLGQSVEYIFIKKHLVLKTLI